MRWFGEHWDAPVCDDCKPAPTPVGQPCADCKRPIAQGDQGLLIPCVRLDAPAGVVAFHHECFMRTVLPCPGCARCQPERWS